MKKIIITGASSGVGKCLAERFAEQGEIIYAIARRKEKLDELARRYPDNIFPYPADISNAKQVKKAFAEIQQASPDIEVLINNASVLNRTLFGQVDFEVIDKSIDINLKGGMYCTYAVLPGMMERKRGYIINIASVAGIPGTHWSPPKGLVAWGDYQASKAGLVGFADFMGKSLRHHNILMTTICPGRIGTEIWEQDGKRVYLGGEGELLQPEDIFDLVSFIITRPPRTLYKQVVLFPSSDWH